MGWFGSVTTPRAAFGLCALLGSLAEIATAGAAAATPTLITAIRGAFNGPPHVAGQLSASLPRAAFASQAPPSCGDPMDALHALRFDPRTSAQRLCRVGFRSKPGGLRPVGRGVGSRWTRS